MDDPFQPRRSPTFRTGKIFRPRQRPTATMDMMFPPGQPGISRGSQVSVHREGLEDMIDDPFPYRPRREGPIVPATNPFQSHHEESKFQPHQKQNDPSIANPLQIRREPPPTRHKRFSDKLTWESSNQPCDEYSRKESVAQDYWKKNEELEEEVEVQREFISKLKAQRRELEVEIARLIGRIDELEGRR